MPLIGLGGRKGMAYMAKVITRDSTQGMVKIWEIMTRHGKQLARHSWDVVNPGLDEPRKEAVVPRVAEYLKRQDVIRRPAGPLLRTDMASRGFSSY